MLTNMYKHIDLGLATGPVAGSRARRRRGAPRT